MSFIRAVLLIEGKMGEVKKEFSINLESIVSVVPIDGHEDRTAIVLVNKDVLVVEGKFEDVAKNIETWA